MKAFVFEGVNRVALKEVSEPKLCEEGAVIRVVSAAVCATDVKIYKHGHFKIKDGESRILGHEIFGEIYEISDGFSDRFPAGTKVFVAPNIGCGKCNYCLVGKYNLCPDYDAFGITLDGALAEYMFIPARAFEQGNVMKVKENEDEVFTPLVEPLSTCVYNLNNISIKPGDKVLVFGAGFMGSLNALVAKHMGASFVAVVDPKRERLEKAKEIGIHYRLDPSVEDIKKVSWEITEGQGFDVVIVTAPLPEVQALSLEIVAKLGRVSFFAGLPKKSNFPSINTNLIHYNQLVLTGTTGADVEYYRRALEMFHHRDDLREDIKKLVTSVVTLEELPEAFERLTQGIELKVVVKTE
ncbi:zinc-dependent dehydrogenase [Thermotoga neapolitana]|jgi:threonine dehydrogenase-like Zn-dependent dehydrogenase|uniref:Alcohol dehydrogenase GroES domain protein n=2 Tax=Thermotoga TaxID=2335 RepID=B9KBZ9_THENN|nr:Zn-dependent alcohol dehydrogenase [Thermotoga neapolitana]ACM22545.1 Alcohol dehydrogenase GroES domain protein [Thermotoga neapolitana DSM 4359]KFZ22190.1 Alcohol dehydrogenase GroES domain protein [Thermotoga neapolitana LA10]